MNVAVFSDIHGNCVALDAMLADLGHRSADAMVCLGDAVQGGTQPREVVDRLKELACPVIMGNADDFLSTGELGGGSVETVSESLLRVREWTLEQLGPDGVAFVRSFVPTHDVVLEGGRTMLCFHGSPRSFNDVLLPESPDEEVEAAFSAVDADVLTGGHTHLQWVRRFGDRSYFNPGSVGLPYNRYTPRESFYIHPLAQYALVRSSGGHVGIELCQVPVDVDELERAARASGHPFAGKEAARYRPPARA